MAAKSEVSDANDVEINMSTQQDFISRPAPDKPLQVSPEVIDDIVKDVAIEDLTSP